MYLLDSSAIITPFHGGQLRALSAALKHNSLQKTQDWLEDWFRRGFSSGILVITHEVYEEVLKKKQRKRPEQVFLKDLRESSNLRILNPADNIFAVLINVHEFVEKHYEAHHAHNFLQKVDPSLVAFAKTHGATLVAEEHHFIPQVNRAQGLIAGEPRLPYVAWVFGVRCISFLTLLREVTF